MFCYYVSIYFKKCSFLQIRKLNRTAEVRFTEILEILIAFVLHI